MHARARPRLSVGRLVEVTRTAVIVAAVLELSGAYLAGGHVTDTVRKGILDLSALNREMVIAGHEAEDLIEDVVAKRGEGK